MDFRRKTPEKLYRQYEKVIQATEETKGFPVLKEHDPLFTLSEEELKAQYPDEYPIYLRLLRQGKIEWIHALNSIQEYIKTQKDLQDKGTEPQEGEIILHNRQINSLINLGEFLEAGKKAGYLKLPTGYGKTVLFAELLKATRLPSIIVVPTIDIIDQTFKKLSKGLDIGIVCGDTKEYGHDIIITTYDSLRIALQNGKLDPDVYKFVILDEAHKALGEKTQETLKMLDNNILIGFTATPDYTMDKSIRSFLPNEIDSLTVVQAIEQDLLCGVKVHLVKTNVDLTSVPDFGDDYNQEELAKAMNNPELNQKVVEEYLNHYNGRKAIVNCVNLEHAKHVAALFQKAGIKANFVSGKPADQTPAEREKTIEAFRNNELAVLSNAQLLIEGFDDPTVDLIMNAAPTRSAVRAEQRMGRGLRKDKKNPNKQCIVVEFIPYSYFESRIITGVDVLEGKAVVKAVSSPTSSPGGKTESEDAWKDIDIPVTGTPEEAIAVLPEKKEKVFFDINSVRQRLRQEVHTGNLYFLDIDDPKALLSLLEQHSEWFQAIDDEGKPVRFDETQDIKLKKLRFHYTEDVIETIIHELSFLPIKANLRDGNKEKGMWINSHDLARKFVENYLPSSDFEEGEWHSERTSLLKKSHEFIEQIAQDYKEEYKGINLQRRLSEQRTRGGYFEKRLPLDYVPGCLYKDENDDLYLSLFLQEKIQQRWGIEGLHFLREKQTENTRNEQENVGWMSAPMVREELEKLLVMRKTNDVRKNLAQISFSQRLPKPQMKKDKDGIEREFYSPEVIKAALKQSLPPTKYEQFIKNAHW